VSAGEGGEAAVSVLAEAFAEYPVVRHVLGPKAGDEEPVHRLVRFFVMARRALRGEAVQRLAEERPGAEGVTLTTEDSTNLPFYDRMGYEMTGYGRVSPELETWAFFRRNGSR